MKYSKHKIMSHLYECVDGKCKKKISGWWKDSAFEIYEAIDLMQKELKIEGDLCEIGTWYGRSFLALRNITEDHENCIGIDIFKSQYYDALINNIKDCFGTMEGSKIIKVAACDSVVEKSVVLEPYAPIRIFYIDGDHSYDGALLDLNVAKLSLHPDGIMFLDDYENPRYGLAVVRAVNTFLNENKEFVLAFSSTQRIFLCQRHMVDSYLSSMSNLGWKVGNDIAWPSLINFKHPLGDNSWKVEHNTETFA